MSASNIVWDFVREARVYDGFTKIVRQTYKMPDGQEADWDVALGGRSVALVARTTAGEFILVRQFRVGPGRLLDELPGGYVDASEEVLDAAARELLEETGYGAGEMTVIGRTWLSASSQLEQFCVLAQDCRPLQSPTPDALEFQEVILVPEEAFLVKVRQGDMTDAGLAFMAIDYMRDRGPVQGPGKVGG